MAKDDEYPTRRLKGDVTRSTLEAGLSMVPGVGGTLAVVMTELWTPILERRRTAWFQQLSDDVEALAGDIGDLEHLMGNEAVFDVALKATELALRTRSEEKHKALRAAVLNTAIGREPGSERRDIFLGLLERLTEAHLAMLAFLDGPEKYASEAGVALSDRSRTGGALSTHVAKVFPTRGGTVYGALIADLDAAGLAVAGALLHTTLPDRDALTPRTTDLGRRFLAFLLHPMDEGAPNEKQSAYQAQRPR